MTLGVWIVPLVLVAAVLFLWASAWFENHIAPLHYGHELRNLEAVDTPLAGPAATQTSLRMDDHLAVEPDRSAA